MDYQYLKIEHREAVEILTLSSPKTLNALNSALLAELDDHLQHIAPEVRVLIVTGDGPKSFVAGADISEMATLDSAEGEAFGKRGCTAFRRLETLPIPTIAAVNGFALGGGCELAMACDIRICSSNARFGQPEVGLGITPGFGGTVRLSRLIGMGRAKELIFSARAVKSDEALRIGLVNAVYEPEQLMTEALALAARIAANAPIAIANAKRAMDASFDSSVEEGCAIENHLFGLCFATEDQKNGMKAFLEKGKAEFKNR